MEARPSAPATQPAPRTAATAEAPAPAAANGEGGGDFDALLALLLAGEGTSETEVESAEARPMTAVRPGKGEAAAGQPLPPWPTGAPPEVATAEGDPSETALSEAESLPDLPPTPGEGEGRPEGVLQQPLSGEALVRPETPPTVPQVQAEAPITPERESLPEPEAEDPWNDGPEPPPSVRAIQSPPSDGREATSAAAAPGAAEARETRPIDPARAALPTEDGEQARDEGPAENPGQGDPSPDPDPRQEATRLVTRFQQLQERLAAMVPEPQTDTPPEALDPAGDPALDPLQDLNRELAQGNESRPLRLNLPTPVQDPRWGRDFSERILWLTRNDQSAAELRLNPRHLGPIQVRIQLDDDQATLHIQAHHAATREAVEAALPRLRESLAEAGIQLAQAQVGGQGGSNDTGQGGFTGQDRPTGQHGTGPVPEAPADAVPPTRVLASDGLLDTFV